MSDDQQPIIVKRIKKGGGGHHGGAWKIAYADFVTAMMAFFLLMWLLGSESKGTLSGISEFFQTPLKLALGGGEGSGDSSSIIKGGGEELTRSSGQVKRGDVESKKIINLDAIKEKMAEGESPGGKTDATPSSKDNADQQDQKSTKTEQSVVDDQAVRERIEKKQLENLKKEIEQVFDATPQLKVFKSQILLDITQEGLRIQIVDEKNRPMFDSASSELKPYTKEILRTIGSTLNHVNNRISLSGHTDSIPFGGRDTGFTNWELSANRANASRRELVVGGMRDAKVMRVVGLADTIPLVQEDPNHPMNRRISIVVLNQKTETAINQGGGITHMQLLKKAEGN